MEEKYLADYEIEEKPGREISWGVLVIIAVIIWAGIWWLRQG